MDEGHILNIAIHPEYRNKGFGSLLIKFSLDYLLKNSGRIMTLEVRKSNIQAIALYRKFGFRVVGIRKNYYISDREDALVMEREF
jgi:ribosomal-protein-alanine N-acetyltransferase